MYCLQSVVDYFSRARRGPHLFLIALAAVIEWRLVSQMFLAASFLATGYFTRERLGMLLKANDDLLEDGVAEMEKAQADLGRKPYRHNPGHDFFDQDPKRRYVCMNTFGDLPTQSDPEMAVAIRKHCLEGIERLKSYLSMRPSDILELSGSPALSAQDLQVPIVPLDPPAPAAGTLAHLIARPDMTNAGEPEHFERCFKMLFEKSEIFKSKPLAYMEHVMNFQLSIIKKHFIKLKKVNSPVVRSKDLHAYVWTALKAAQLTSGCQRDRLLQTMIGDFKKYSLTPHGRKDRDEELAVDVEMEDAIGVEA